MTSNHKAGALDYGIAALAAGAAGFLAFAMPETVFTRLVEMSRLPEFVAAAQPPLGDTARLGAVGMAAALTFLVIFLLMRSLDRTAAPRATAPERVEEVLRLRAADAHPDAPARRPLLAGRELGEPQEVEAAVPPPEADAPIEWRVTSEEPAADLDPQPLPGFLVADQPEEPVAEAEALPEPAFEAEPETLELQPEEEAEPQWHEPESFAAEAPVAQEDDREESVTELMQRLESGLGRRQKPQALSRDDAPLRPSAEVEDRVGHRLRSAINDLQKMAGRGA